MTSAAWLHGNSKTAGAGTISLGVFFFSLRRTMRDGIRAIKATDLCTGTKHLCSPDMARRAHPASQ
jgi:hypothetical protein